ncbi:hypothetical protein [Komagataeibacter rhaeticus]|uniref:hypothetical protein n=1 Tax=Komagataeibacter rhaeticus TaxID=215221 RepID=UPI0011B85975|nr:hypothetical protein [Komagataeibacter rhaeticus]MBL7238679.1 hypothetical protein [Komagataeibacter rhaeticus]
MDTLHYRGDPSVWWRGRAGEGGTAGTAALLSAVPAMERLPADMAQRDMHAVATTGRVNAFVMDVAVGSGLNPDYSAPRHLLPAMARGYRHGAAVSQCIKDGRRFYFKNDKKSSGGLK